MLHTSTPRGVSRQTAVKRLPSMSTSTALPGVPFSRAQMLP